MFFAQPGMSVGLRGDMCESSLCLGITQFVNKVCVQH